MNIGVIGAGISGLSVSQMLSINNNVTVFEVDNSIGGLIKCERVNDCLFHKVGGHVFNSKNLNVLEWFWSFFDKDIEFVQAKRNANILLGNGIINYPIENYIYKLDKEVIVKVVDELLTIAKESETSNNSFNNFEEFLKGSFGETLFKIYFEPYNIKIWNIDLKRIPLEWLEGKLPMPNLRAILTNNIVREEETEMVHSTFFYPRKNGSQFIIDRLSKNINILRNFNINKVCHNKDGICINDNFSFHKIIYTGDIRKMPKTWDNFLVEEGIDINLIKSLTSNGTSNLFCETDDTDMSWLYIPEASLRAHRIIYTGNFSKDNNKGTSRNTCVVEFSGKVEYDIMVEEVKKLPGNMSPLAHNYQANSYIIHDQNTKNTLQKVQKILNSKNIILLGRFAEWEYYNMDKAIETSMRIAKEIDFQQIK